MLNETDSQRLQQLMRENYLNDDEAKEKAELMEKLQAIEVDSKPTSHKVILQNLKSNLEIIKSERIALELKNQIIKEKKRIAELKENISKEIDEIEKPVQKVIKEETRRKEWCKDCKQYEDQWGNKW